MNEQMRQLVDALDKTHKSYVNTIHNHGGVNLEASKLGREYKDIQREIIVADLQNNKKK
tara:strand:+ start:487 stop:663 length:177 start_codon:yes stop_codon:yes gene_type:complete